MRLTGQIYFLIAAVALLIAPDLRAQEASESELPGPPDDQVVPVAEEALPDAGAVTAELSDEEQLAIQFKRYKTLLSEGVLDEADGVAKRVVELAIRVAGPRSNDTAKALTNLAIVQHRNKQYDAAEQNFETAVEIIEDNEDRLNDQLINPLKGLGASQLESGRPDLALTTFNRAVHVSHVNQGPHNLSQIDLLESLAESNLRLGSIEDAKEIQDKIFSLHLRYYSRNALDMIPVLMRRAAWQHRAGFIFDERATYRRIVKIIEGTAGKDDLSLVEPLTRLGESYFYMDLSGEASYQPAAATTGEIYFKRAVRIAKENPEATWQDQATTLLSLGDYYMFQGNEQRAGNIYSDVWQLLNVDDERLEFRSEALERLVTLREQPFPQYAGAAVDKNSSTPADPLLEGRVAITYIVSARGRVQSLKIIEAQPSEFSEMLREIQREMRRRIYRPHFQDGEPAISPEHILTHRFYYRQADLDAIRNAQATEEIEET